MRLAHRVGGILVFAACQDPPAQAVPSGVLPQGSRDPRSPAATRGPADADMDPARGRPHFKRCRDPQAPPPALAEPFKHTRSGLVALQGEPRHSAPDVLVVGGSPATLTAKFDYGKLGKDLEDEAVQLVVFDCSNWRGVGDARTDTDGRIAVPVADDLDLPIGAYALRHMVVGDGTMASSNLTVVPEGTRIVVFDIDGTLTVSDGEVTREVLNDDYTPERYAGAVELTRAWADRGYLLVYLTGRPYWLSGPTRRWLDAQGFAPGHVRTTDLHRQVTPSAGGVGTFKTGVLRDLVDAGLQIEAAYGNAPTDIAAYEAVGIPVSRTFIIGPHADDKRCTPTGADYVARATEVATGPQAEQPYRPHMENRPTPAAK